MCVSIECEAKEMSCDHRLRMLCLYNIYLSDFNIFDLHYISAKSSTFFTKGNSV